MNKICFFLTLFALIFNAHSRDMRTLESDEWINFTRGNKIKFNKGSEVNYRPDGSILFVFASGPATEITQWKTPQGVTYPLYCGGQLATGTSSAGDSSKLIWFYESGEYLRGCVALSTFEFNNSTTAGRIGYNSEFALFESGALQYISSTYDGSVELNEMALSIKPRSEIYFYENGIPEFFTPLKEQNYSFDTPYGKIKFHQVNPEISISLSSEGEIERAIVAEDLEINNFRISKDSGLAFDKDPNQKQYLDTVFLSNEVEIQSQEGHYLKAKSVRFRPEGSIEIVEVNNSFKFIQPETKKIVNVQPGDLVYLDPNKKIIRIDFRIRRP